MLASVLIALSIADVLTTNAAHGMSNVMEANPVMAYAQATLGGFWWLPKLAVTLVVARYLARLPWRWPLPAMVGLYGLIVINNLYWIGAP